MNRQIASRISGENRGERAMVQLLMAVSVWRTAAARIIPVFGASGWWMALLCMLPGIAAALLLRLAMALTGVSTATEAVRVCLGRIGAAAFSAVLAALLLAEAVSAMTALLCVFTQVVGTRGTRFTLAVLTGAVMLFSLHREGLPRAVYLLRWLMGTAVLLAAGYALGDARLDHLFPLHGTGDSYAIAGFLSVPGLAWPVTLLLTLPPCEQRGRLCSAVVPLSAAVATVFIAAVTVPHELLIRRASLAETLLLPAWFAPNAVRVLWLCLLMLTFFLAMAACIQQAARHISAPVGCIPGWLAIVLLVGLVLTQAAEPRMLMALLALVEPWLLLALGMTALTMIPLAIIRRKRP